MSSTSSTITTTTTTTTKSMSPATAPSRSVTNTFSSTNPFRSTTIFVGNLSSHMTETKLFQLFGKFGAITSGRLCKGHAARGRRSHAYINYDNIGDAEQAIKTMNFRFISGKQCRVMWYQKNHTNFKQCSKSNVFVKNLDPSVDNKMLFETFSIFGEILSVKVMRNPSTNKSLGYGYVNFVIEKAAHEAIKGVNGLQILNRPIYAQLFKPKHERGYGNGNRNNAQHFTNVYVKFIPHWFTQQTLIDLFERETQGTVTNSHIWRKPFGVSACLNFSNNKQARLAIEKLNQRRINAYQLYVAKAQKKQKRAQVLQQRYNCAKPQNNNHRFSTANNQYFQTKKSQNGLNNAYASQNGMNNYNFVFPSNVPRIPMQYNIQRPIQPNPMCPTHVNGMNNGNIKSGNELKQNSVPMPPCIQTVLPSQPMYSSQPNLSVPMISAPMMELDRLTKEKLAQVKPELRKRVIGERLFSQIQSIEPRLAGKITGMLLELDNDDLLVLLSNQKKLCERINEALDVLKEYRKQISSSNNNGSTPN